MSKPEIVICSPVRTAIGTYNGSLKTTPATKLGSVAVRETLRRSGIDPAKIDGIVMGNVIQAGNKMNPARQAAVHAGVPVSAPAMTVNRVCGSGAQAVASAAQEIWLGFAKAMLAGGMENMDMAPYLMGGGRPRWWPLQLRRRQCPPPQRTRAGSARISASCPPRDPPFATRPLTEGRWPPTAVAPLIWIQQIQVS